MQEVICYHIRRINRSSLLSFQVYPIMNMIAEKLPFPAEVVSQKMLDAKREKEERFERDNINPYTFKYIIQNNMLGCHRWIRNIDKEYYGKYV